jgi:hypothetical protein
LILEKRLLSRQEIIDQKSLQFETMWSEISKILKPLGQLPDKASIDYQEALIKFAELRSPENKIRDLAQVSILRKELTMSILRNLVN